MQPQRLAALAALLTAASLSAGCIVIDTVPRADPRANQAQAGSIEPTTRSLTWSGGQALTVSVPGEVSFTPGPVAQITATGPERLVQALRIDEGEIGLDRACGSACQRTGGAIPPLRISVTAPGIERFATTGAAGLDIHDYQGPRLALTLSGASRITATGRTPTLKLSQSGASRSDLAALALDEATVDLSGASQARLAPIRSAKVQASGAARVNLTVVPGQMESAVMGAARVTTPNEPRG